MQPHATINEVIVLRNGYTWIIVKRESLRVPLSVILRAALPFLNDAVINR